MRGVLPGTDRIIYRLNGSLAWDATEDEHNPLLDAAAEGPVDMPQGCTQEYKIHIHLQCEPFTAIDAPLTEIVLWKLKDRAKKEVVEELLTGLMKIVNAIPRSAGMHKAGWGSVPSNERQYVVMIGWDTMEVCCISCLSIGAGLTQVHRRSPPLLPTLSTEGPSSIGLPNTLIVRSGISTCNESLPLSRQDFKSFKTLLGNEGGSISWSLRLAH